MPAVKRKFDATDIKRMITGVFVSLLAVLFVCAIASALLSSAVIGEEVACGCSACALALGAAAGGFYAARNRGERYLLTALICGIIFFAIRMVCNMLFGGKGNGLTNIEGAICILGGSVLGGLPQKQKRKRKR